MSVKQFFKKAFEDMKESAKAQHEVDKANFDAVKAESKANFEENRAHNTFAKAKKSSKERQAKIKEEQEKQIAVSNARKQAALKKLEELKK